MFTRKQRQKCPYKNHEVKTFVKSFISSQKSKVLSVFSLLSAYLTRRILSDKIEQNGFYFPVGKIARCVKESVFFARVRCLNRKYFPSHLFFQRFCPLGYSNLQRQKKEHCEISFIKECVRKDNTFKQFGTTCSTQIMRSSRRNLFTTLAMNFVS